MRYPSMSPGREYRVSVPQLSGGVNQSVPPHLIADNQLSEADNLWWKDGVLKTRPALKGVGLAFHDAGTRLQYGSVGEYGYIAGISSAKNYVTLINKDGTTVPNMAINRGTAAPVSMMLAPVNGGLPTSVCSDDVIVYMKGEAEDDTGVFSVSSDSGNTARTALQPYIPTVLMNGRPQDAPTVPAGGSQLEPYNMLTDECICTFTPDGKGLYYSLPENTELLQVTFHCLTRGKTTLATVEQTLTYKESLDLYVGGSNATQYIVVYNKGLNSLYFCDSPIEDSSQPTYNTPIPMQEGADNSIIVRLRRTDTDEFRKSRNAILGMRFSTWFGGGSEGLSGGTRLFVSGNPDHPNLVHWSALNDPLYFPENNYAYVGEDSNAVTAFGKQSDMLVIFKERELYYTTYNLGNTVDASDIESQTVVDIEAAAAVFSMLQLHPMIGCDCPDTVRLCNNRLVWLNSDGRVYGLFSAGVYSERNLRVLSLQVEKELRKFTPAALRAASSTLFKEQYLLLIGDTILAMDYSSYGFNYYSSYSTDEKAQKNVVWHRWTTDIALCAAVLVGTTAVMIGTDGVDGRRHTFVWDTEAATDDVPSGSRFSETGKIESVVKTKLFDFGAPERQKRVNSMYIQVSGARGKSVFLGYHSGNADYENKERLVLTGDKAEAAKPFRVTPNMIRVRQFGFSLKSEGRIEVGSLILNYSMMGAMR